MDQPRGDIQVIKCRVLFVCLGNICRSPAAEGVLVKLLADAHLDSQVEVDSAGTGDWHLGDLPDQRMRQAGAERGYELNHRARQINTQDFRKFDMIITMDEANYRNVIKLAPEKEDQAKVHRFVSFSEKLAYKEVPDPYHGTKADFSLVLDILEDGCRNLIKQLSLRL